MQLRMFGPVDARRIREVSAEQLALDLLNSFATDEHLNASNTIQGAREVFSRDGEEDVTELLGKLSDAWAWLSSHGLIGPSADQAGAEWLRITAAGRKARLSSHPLSEIYARDLLATDLHPGLAVTARANFALGDYETAAFAAMKAVEVEVRRLSGADAREIGTNLMRSAFHSKEGPLTDLSAEASEREAMAHLFAGAIGAFKNPASHRPVEYSDPVEAAEVIQTADLLMRILRRVETRLSQKRPDSQ